jgi:hypothetical protein
MIACLIGISNINVDIGVTKVEGMHAIVNGLNLCIGPIRMFGIPEVIDKAPFTNAPPSLSAVIDTAPDAIRAADTSASKNVEESIEFFIFILH